MLSWGRYSADEKAGDEAINFDMLGYRLDISKKKRIIVPHEINHYHPDRTDVDLGCRR